MRLSVIRHSKTESVFYNPGVFQEDEDLIIFPFKEFDEFYNETVQSLNVVKNMIKDSLKSETTTNPLTDLKHIGDWINLIQEYMDFLIKFDTQTTLNSFNKSSIKKIKPKTRVDEINNIQRDQIQCLMGL